MPEPKRHHYVPQFYLKNFTDPDKPGVLWVMSASDQSSRWRERGTRAVAYGDNFNTIHLPSGEASIELERLYGESENRHKPVVEKLIAGDYIDDVEKLLFASFVSELLTRVPMARSLTKQHFDALLRKQGAEIRQYYTSNPEKLTEYVNQREAEGGEPTSEAKLMEYLNPERYRMEVTDQYATLSAILFKPLYINALLSRGWVFIHSDATSEPNYFVTSDFPAVPMRPKHLFDPNQGLRMEDLEFSLPLSRTTCFLAARWADKTRHADVDAKNVLAMNARTASMATRLLIAPKPEFINSETVLKCWTGVRPKANIS